MSNVEPRAAKARHRREQSHDIARKSWTLSAEKRDVGGGGTVWFERTKEKVMEVDRVEIAITVVKRPLKKLFTEVPWCFVIGFMVVRSWPCSE